MNTGLDGGVDKWKMRKFFEGYPLPCQVLVWQGVTVELEGKMRKFLRIVDNSIG